MEFTKIEDLLNYILGVYADERPDRDSELALMGVYDSLDKIAKAMDIRATLVKVVL